MDYAGKPEKDKLKEINQAGKAVAFSNFKAARQYNKGRDNGQLSRQGMVWVGQGEQLRPRAAKAWVAMREAAKAQGITFGVTDAYRTLGEQKQLASQIGLYGPGNRQGAAKPGTSVHGQGRAVDVSYGPKSQNSLDSYSDKEAKWLAKNAGRYGFSQNVAGEPWHISFNPKQFDKSVVEGINLKVTNSGKVKAVAGPGYTPKVFTAPTWKPTTKKTNQSVTDAKDSDTYQGGGTATASSGATDMAGAAPSLTQGKVF